VNREEFDHALRAAAQPTVARLETGGVTPSLDTLQRAADAFGLELVVDFR
jgi:transcriptional regulator with XRE-family HTH domain